jgi:hypothetical protein
MKTLQGKRVRVYRNLHKDCFSVKCMKTGRVIAHVKEIVLKEVTYPVSKAGRERVLKDKRKNVHAFVQGLIDINNQINNLKVNKICYNPYKKGHFFYCNNGREIKQSKKARVSMTGVFAYS